MTRSFGHDRCRVVRPPDARRLAVGDWYFDRWLDLLPKKGEICIADRSWYNRAVLEPVMGFCTADDTQDFLDEVRHFERALVASGIPLTKIWLWVERDVQQRRIAARANPSAVDLAAASKWDAYTLAEREMFARTSTADAPWLFWDGVRLRPVDPRRGHPGLEARDESDCA